MLLRTTAVQAPNVAAHNTAKYTNIPFLSAINCPAQGGTAEFVKTNSGLQLQFQIGATIDDLAGFRILCSSPGSGQPSSGMLNLYGSFPPGTLTFSVTGSTNNLAPRCHGNHTNGKVLSYDVTNTNGLISINCTSGKDGANLRDVVFKFSTATTDTASTVYLSNFRYSNQPLLFDTTFTGNANNISPAGGPFCDLNGN